MQSVVNIMKMEKNTCTLMCSSIKRLIGVTQDVLTLMATTAIIKEQEEHLLK
ncbi:hypothetical protein [Geminiviridae sp.]|nr:hypothetical protein [Geminiviridae sp.]